MSPSFGRRPLWCLLRGSFVPTCLPRRCVPSVEMRSRSGAPHERIAELCRNASSPPRSTLRFASMMLTPQGDPLTEDHTSRRFKRTRSGCQKCRERRVKCDEVKPVCGNCTKLSTTCRWSLGQALEQTSPSTEPPIRKRRKPIRRLPTCIPCHLAKARCSHTPPSCERCVTSGRQCTWPQMLEKPSPDHPITPVSSGPDVFHFDPRSLRAGASSPSPTGLQLDSLLGPGIRLHTLVNAFFTHVHPTQAMSFLHQGQLLRDVKEGSASPLLIRAICAVSLRFLDSADRNHPDGGTLAAKWAKCGLLVIRIKLLSAWQWVALAARMALAMGLDSSRFMAHSTSYLTCPWVTQETAKRLMWATVSADALGSSAHAKYKLLHTDIDLDLPANEYAFRMGQRPETTQRLNEGHSSGSFMAGWVRLMLLRRSVLSYSCYGHQEPLKPWEDGSTFHILEEQLDIWHGSLPADMKFTVDNLYIRHSSAELTSLAGLHLLFDLVRISLFRIGVSAVTFSGDSVYPDMPAEFSSLCRGKAYNVGIIICDRLRAIEDHFPDYTSSSRLWVRSVHASLRIHIEHQEDSTDVDVDLLDGFRTLVRTVAKMTRYFSTDRKTVRDLLDMLAQHGYSLYADIDDTAVASRSGTPTIPHLHTGASGDGQILSDIPWVRRKESNMMDVGGPRMFRSTEGRSPGGRTSVRDLPSTSISALRNSQDDLRQPSGLGVSTLPRPSSEFLLPALSDEPETQFSLWTQFQPELQQTIVPDLESLFGLPQDWS